MPQEASWDGTMWAEKTLERDVLFGVVVASGGLLGRVESPVER